MSEQGIRHCEVAIVGGGMVGATLALAMAGRQRRITLIEAIAPESEAQPSFDDRTTALGNGARRIYETLGVWSEIAAQAAPITHIHISEAGHFAFARLDAAAHGLAALGYTVSNRHLGQVLWRALRACSSLTLWSPARVTDAQLSARAVTLTVQQDSAAPVKLRTQLAVAADGAQSLLKQAAHITSSTRDYQQVALVGSVRTDDCAAQGRAYERFTATGPIALLPRVDGSYAVIWTLSAQQAAALQVCSEAEFCARLQHSFGWRAGAIVAVGRRASYPLSLTCAAGSVGQRTAVIGNAAQALHPVAAQGVNLGLRDAAVLAELVADAADPGDSALLAQFERLRSADRRAMIGFTDRLVRLFNDRRSLVSAARDLGLLLFDLTPPAKQALSRLSWGFGRLPRLSRGLPL